MFPFHREMIEACESLLIDWESGFLFEVKAEHARAERNRRNEREAREGQGEADAGSSELEEAIDDASRLLPLVPCKPDNPQPMMVGLGKESVNFLDLLISPGFLQALNHLTTSDTGPTLLPRLQTELKPWQAVGVTKLLQSTEAMFKGAFLCDEAGTGKSLTALTAALIKRKQMLPRCGFVLIVCSPESVHRWCWEIKRHFKKDDRPSCIILNSTNIWCHQLLQFEVVICSTSFLIKTFLNRREFICFCDTIRAFDIQVAQKRFPRKMVRPSLPLHSGLYKSWNRNIPVLILDESHDAHDESTLLNAAVRSLDYHHAFLLSGTPMKNSWRDLAGQSMILPGSPIQNMDKFDEIFKTAQSTSAGGNQLMPEGVFWNMFSRYFMGQIISRPRSLPSLPDRIMRVTVPSKPQDRLMYLKITFLVFEGKKLIKNPKTVRPGLAILKKAQQLASHPALCSRPAISAEMDEDLTDPFAEFEMDVVEKLNSFLGGCFEPGQAVNGEKCNSRNSLLSSQPLYGPWPEDVWKQLEAHQRQLVTDGKAKLDSLTVDELARFKKYWHSQPCAFSKGHLFLRLGLDHDDVELVDNKDASSPTPELLDSEFSVCSDDLKAADDSAYQDDGFKNHEDIHDDIHEDDDSAMDEEEDSGDDDDPQRPTNSPERGTKRSNLRWTTAWENHVSFMEKDESMSPRVRAIASKVAELLRQHQDEKVIVTSTSVLFLDIIFSVVRKNPRDISGINPWTVRYDGSVPLDHRARNADLLNQPVDVAKKDNLLDALSVTDDKRKRENLLFYIEKAEGPRVLLLDAHAAGPGLSLTGASRIIFCEQFWTPGLADKVIGCVQRFPQEKPVHVYQFFDEMSDIDVLVKDMIGDKHEPIPSTPSFFTRLDTDIVQVPGVPTLGEHALALEELNKNRAAV